MSMTEERSLDLQSIRDGDDGPIIRPWRSGQLPQDSPLHRMMSRVGGFPPALVRYFIGAYSRPGDVILDPFCGKGTTLLEAAVAGRRAVGGDISRTAVISARAKTYPVTTSEVANYVQDLPASLNQVCSDIPASVSLFFQKETFRHLLACANAYWQTCRIIKLTGSTGEELPLRGAARAAYTAIQPFHCLFRVTRCSRCRLDMSANTSTNIA